MGATSAESGASFRAKEEEESKIITLRVKWVDDDEDKEKEGKFGVIHFKIENDIALRWLMIRYCDKIGADFHTTRFEFKGAKLRDTDTPLQLSMLSSDLIYAYHFLCGNGRCAEHYVTLCIRVPKERDTFIRVRRAAPLLPQLMCSFSDDVGSLCFVYDWCRLTEKDTADNHELEDGDIIDAFDFDESSSSLSIVEPSFISLKVVNPNHRDYVFNIRQTSLLSKVFDRYCKILSVQNEAAFMFKGRRLMGSKTVEEERLKGGDEIEVIIE
ncbi:uncharacterized protein LOC110719610 [Chenopodium quinoa]|uniref:uncharacterized protein LOC110719610 n=1 Tax=Chenopodium quinoa TaxID=63459 RepID=UPI000B77E92B|nr:uncharacterized protein LOC110719610 [Chenopodium quinoa]